MRYEVVVVRERLERNDRRDKYQMPHAFSNSSATRQMDIKHIDDEIQSLTQQIQRLKSRRNSLSITSTLPIEIITEIFIIIQIQTYNPNNPTSTLRLWLPITHVCRHWRALALECSHLWSLIYSLPEAGIREFLARSNKGPLFVDISRAPSSQDPGPADYSEGLLAAIFAQCSRIQELGLRSWDNLDQMLPHLTSGSAPKLEALSIAGDDDVGDLVNIPGDVDIFQGTTPQLNTLFLYKCRIVPQCSLLMNDLTNLNVEDCPMGSTMIWLNIVRRMSHLSHLSLVRCFTDRSGDHYTPIPTDFEVIHLHHLSTLAIEGSWLQSDLSFLAHITFPSQTELAFTSNTGRSASMPQPTAPPLVAFLQVQNRSRQGLPQMRGASVKLEESPSLGEATANGMVLRFSVLERQNYVCVEIGGIPSVYCDQILLTELTPLLSSTLSITFYISCRLPNVRDIWCSSHAIGTFLSALSTVPQGDVPPQIEELCERENVHTSALSNTISHNSTSRPPFKWLEGVGLYRTSIDTFATPLAAALRFRLEMGLPLKTVQFFRVGDVPVDLLSRLRELVDEVKYDPRDNLDFAIVREDGDLEILP
ncbi:hypothetical protein BDN72DRAFT_861416 [Pluteus cervinus]|uniref:Uncharacterized protein n=1 Tax=Pluteus cervinus TaxID=181527 RepID=A0ACD3AEM3_9AGAR|nr:hypothetical protein BDN72DRAFT_861416 [Pluteus cervinus]